MKTLLLCFLSLLFAGTLSAQDLATRLGTAASKGNLKEVKKLVEKEGADVNSVLEINASIRIPLLVKMAMENKAEIAIYLIEKGANVQVSDGFGMTSLMWAAYNGNTDLVQLLLEKGADKHTQTASGLTALDAAQEKGHTAIIELLK